MTTLIQSDDHATLWALMAAGTAISIWLEQRFRWAAKLSGPVLALLIAMALSNTRIVPMESRAYDFVTDWLVPLAIPLLLFRANFREIIGTGRLFLVFHIAAIGTLCGTFLAVVILKRWIASPDLAHAAGMMAASYIGGGVNFMAVKASYGVREAVSNPLIVADNFVMAGFFVVLLAIAASRWFLARYPHPHSESNGTEKNLAAEHWQRKGISLLDVAITLSFAFAVFAIATLLGKFTRSWFGDISKASVAIQVLHVLCTNKFVLLTTVTLLGATLLSRSLKRINGADELGTYMLLLFLFTLGLPADLIAVIVKAPLFLVFCGIIAVTNLVFTLIVGKLFRLNLEELLLSVNATLGGAPSAAAMATSSGWPRLILPGILVGIWGYVIGTPVGVLVVEVLLR